MARHKHPSALFILCERKVHWGKKKKNSCSFKLDASRTELPAAGCWLEQAMWRTGQSILTTDWHHSWRTKVSFTGQQKLLSYWIDCWIEGRMVVSIVPHSRHSTRPATHLCSRELQPLEASWERQRFSLFFSCSSSGWDLSWKTHFPGCAIPASFVCCCCCFFKVC